MAVRKHNEGVTLLEVMLVLIIGASIIYFSLQQYLSYRTSADILAVQSNVDVLFESLGNYYHANCYGNIDPVTLRPNGTLNPATFPPTNFPVTLSVLKQQGYLTQNLPLNPLIDNSDPAVSYIMQFNQAPVTQRRVCQTQGCSQGVNVGSVIVWQAQVSVLLKNQTSAKAYKNIMGADCLSTNSGSYVVPCSSSANTGNYVVWTRPPSFASSKANSTYWLSLPAIKQFTQMYTTYPILVLTDQTDTANQYYVCGN